MTNINVLKIRPELICDFIENAREFQAKEEVTFPEDIENSEYDYDWSQVLADHQDDMTYRETKNVIESLTLDEKIDLLALLYLGRGDFEKWDEAYIAAENNLPENLTDYLLAHPLLAEHFIRALEILQFTCEQ